MNGNQNPDQNKYQSGEKVDYSCNENYELRGSPLAICIPSGEWSHPVPICQGMS